MEIRMYMLLLTKDRRLKPAARPTRSACADPRAPGTTNVEMKPAEAGLVDLAAGFNRRSCELETTPSGFFPGEERFVYE
jgi:hypothetical protein